MLIDWFTVGAQALNFIILVWLLKHFLYKPILEAIDAREKLIADEVARAKAQQIAAEKERDEFKNRTKAFEEQRSTLIGKISDEAKAARELLLADARREVESLRMQQKSAVQMERAKLGGEVTRLAAEEVFAIARKVLMDLATANLEESMGELFTRRLPEMDEKAKGALATALETSSNAAVVRSTFELPTKTQAGIQHALNETFNTRIQVRFETAFTAISGIELTVGGQRLAWSIAEYLAELERKLGSLLDAQATPTAKMAAAP